MNKPPLQTGAVVRLQDTGYTGNPYVHVDHKTCPVMFFWWADTPTGRQSRYWHAFTVARVRSSGKMLKDPATGMLTTCYVPTAYYDMGLQQIRDAIQLRVALPKIPRGYVWQGPFLRCDVKAPVVESSSFRRVEPERSDGLALGYLVTMRADGQLVAGLAQKILADRQHG